MQIKLIVLTLVLPQLRALNQEAASFSCPGHLVKLEQYPYLSRVATVAIEEYRYCLHGVRPVAAYRAGMAMAIINGELELVNVEKWVWLLSLLSMVIPLPNCLPQPWAEQSCGLTLQLNSRVHIHP